MCVRARVCVQAYTVTVGTARVWDGVVSDTRPFTFNASRAAAAQIDLSAHIASVLAPVHLSHYSVVSVKSSTPGLFSADVLADGHTMVIKTPQGPSCGTCNITVGVGAGVQHVALDLQARKFGTHGPNLLANPQFDNVSKTPGVVPGWHTNTWNGDFMFSQPTGVGYSEGGRCGEVQGFGAGKFGLYQTVELTPGTYELGAVVASVELESGQCVFFFGWLVRRPRGSVRTGVHPDVDFAALCCVCVCARACACICVRPACCANV